MLDFVWNDLLLNPMTNALIVLSHALFDNFGLAIIAFTILIRLVTYPLTLRQLRTTRAMQAMQPRIQELQKRYKDPKRRQQEMMKVYREVGFNPLGCVLPLLIQMPIWFAMFRVVRATLSDTPEALVELSSKLYNWDYITTAVPLDRHFLLLDLSNPSLPLAVLVAAATFLQQKLSTGTTPPRDERSAATNRTLLWIMPLLFGWFTISVPAGLGLYWVTSSVFSIVTSYLYYGRRRLTWRWLFSLDPLPAPLQPAAIAGATGAGDRAPTDSGSDEADTQESDQPAPSPRSRRARRRRRRRAAGANEGAGPDGAEP